MSREDVRKTVAGRRRWSFDEMVVSCTVAGELTPAALCVVPTGLTEDATPTQRLRAGLYSAAAPRLGCGSELRARPIALTNP